MLLAVNSVGTDFPVNFVATGAQIDPAVALDADGNFIIVWQSDGQDGSGEGIFARRYNAAGVAQGTEFQVNSFTTGNQITPDVAMDPDGNFVITWASYGQDGMYYGAYARRYNAAGVAQGTEFTVGTFTTVLQDQPAIAMDSAGNFVIAWRSAYLDPENGIRAQRYNAAGVAQGGDFRVNTVTGDAQESPAVAMDENGNFVIVWTSDQANGEGAYAQRFNAAGVAQGTNFKVGLSISGTLAADPGVAMDEDGDFVITWTQGITALVAEFQADGTIVVPERNVVNFTPLTSGINRQPTVRRASNGDYVIAWTGDEVTGADGGVYGSFVEDGSQPGVGWFRVEHSTTEVARAAAMGMNADGDFVVAWATGASGSSDFNIMARRYSIADADTTVSMTTTPASLTEDGPGEATLTLTRTGNTTGDLFVQLLFLGTTGLIGDDFTLDGSTSIVTFDAFIEVMIPDGQTTATLSIDPTDDALIEGPETIEISIPPSPAYNVGAGELGMAEVTIEDDEVHEFVLVPTSLTVPEGDSNTFTVQLAAVPASDVTVTIAREAGADSDLISNLTTLIFTPATWNVPQVVTISAARDTDDTPGSATFTLSATGATSASIVVTEGEASPTPGAPVLAAASDTGASSSDSLTNRDNSTALLNLTFVVPGTVAGATVRLFAGDEEIGSAVATGTSTEIVTNGSFDLSDGVHLITATQLEAGPPISAPSEALELTIDTTPAVIAVDQLNSQPDPTSVPLISFRVVSSEAVAGLGLEDVLISGSANAASALLSGDGTIRTLSVSGLSASGTVIASIDPTGLQDLAGNAVTLAPAIDNVVNYIHTAPLAAPPSLNTSTGELSAFGGAGNDEINVAVQDDLIVVTVNLSFYTFAASQVSSIGVFALDGDDRVTIGEGVMGTYVLGGLGNDTLMGGSANDSLTGAAGVDCLLGGEGNDKLTGGKHGNWLFGGDGDDRLYGGDSIDMMYGENGRDRAYGGGGEDMMFGGSHNDTLYGEAGNDRIDGGLHNDRIFPGTGSNVAWGGSGNDNFFLDNGEHDNVSGGAGTDGADSDVIDILKLIEFSL